MSIDFGPGLLLIAVDRGAAAHFCSQGRVDFVLWLLVGRFAICRHHSLTACARLLYAPLHPGIHDFTILSVLCHCRRRAGPDLRCRKREVRLVGPTLTKTDVDNLRVLTTTRIELALDLFRARVKLSGRGWVSQSHLHARPRFAPAGVLFTRYGVSISPNRGVSAEESFVCDKLAAGF